ncbi:MAG TPA: twin-arginine translocase TatA/TatE family subunit [Gaiellaceae bacterium]|jgi:sec-independent protein translocase protein TatA|nr:twin-arginine translocase TatA/TatE family subunit [Gaiellaceae bacterium]
MPGFIGLPEIIALGLLALLLFGPKRLPEMGRGLGKGLREFKDSVTGDNKVDHGLSLSRLDVPEDQTATPMAPEPVAVDHRNVA